MPDSLTHEQVELRDRVREFVDEELRDLYMKLREKVSVNASYKHGAGNDSCRIAMAAGASRAMRHMPKHQDIDLKLFKELFDRRQHGQRVRLAGHGFS